MVSSGKPSYILLFLKIMHFPSLRCWIQSWRRSRWQIFCAPGTLWGY